MSNDGHQSTEKALDMTTERYNASFLVRLWLEPREIEDEMALPRGYIRNLKTGEERYFSDPQLAVEYMLYHLQERHS